MKFDFEALQQDLHHQTKACDSSEQHALIEFLNDQIDSIVEDLRGGNYQEAEIPKLTLQQLQGSLEQFEYHLGYLKAYLKERIQ
jgi:hypothetical protein